MNRNKANQKVPMPVGLLLGLAIFLALLIVQASATTTGADRDLVHKHQMVANGLPDGDADPGHSEAPASAVCNGKCALVFGNTKMVETAV